MKNKSSLHILITLACYQIKAKLNRFLENSKSIHTTTSKLPNKNKNYNWQELKINTLKSVSKKEFTTYVQLIRNFDNELELLNSKKVKFVGKGVGGTSLNTYRKLTTENIVLFEKIYLKESDDLVRLSWFYEHISPQLKLVNICTPSLVKKHCGKKACALYFEFFNAPLDNQSNFLNQAISTSLKLSQLSFPREAIKLSELNFIQNSFYQESKKITLSWIKQLEIENFDFDTYEESVKSLPIWFAHGDIHGKNLGKPNIIIDWDNCGLYPLGFDIAVSMSKALHVANIEHLRFYLDNRIKPFIKKDDWPQFEQSIYFFILVFYARRVGKKITLKTWHSLARSFTNKS